MKVCMKRLRKQLNIGTSSDRSYRSEWESRRQDLLTEVQVRNVWI